jgi:DNA-directed RNA polymerase specialized sigma24 family protein
MEVNIIGEATQVLSRFFRTDREALHDAVQDFCVREREFSARAQSHPNPRAYIRSVARGFALDRLRAQQRDPIHNATDLDHAPPPSGVVSGAFRPGAGPQLNDRELAIYVRQLSERLLGLIDWRRRGWPTLLVALMDIHRDIADPAIRLAAAIGDLCQRSGARDQSLWLELERRGWSKPLRHRQSHAARKFFAGLADRCPGLR